MTLRKLGEVFGVASLKFLCGVPTSSASCIFRRGILVVWGTRVGHIQVDDS